MNRVRLLLSFLILPLLMVVAVLAASISLLPWWGSSALNRLIPAAVSAFTDARVTLQISQLGWRSMHIESFDLELPDQTQMRLNGMSLAYEPAEILSGQIQSVTIEQLDVAMGDTTAVAAKAGTSAALQSAETRAQDQIEIPELGQWLRIPQTRLLIQALNVKHPALDSQLRLESTENYLRINGSVRPAELNQSWDLVALLDQQQQILIQLAQDNRPHLRLLANIEQTEETTTIKLDNLLDLDSLARVFPELNEMAVPKQSLSAIGELTSHNHAHWPEDITGTIRLSLPTQGKTVGMTPKISWQKGTIQADIKRTLDAEQPKSEPRGDEPANVEAPWSVELTQPGLKLAIPLEDDPTTLLHTQWSKASYQLQCVADFSACSSSEPLTFEALVSGSNLPTTQIKGSLEAEWNSGLQQLSGTAAAKLSALLTELPADWLQGNLRSLSTSQTSLVMDIGSQFQMDDQQFILKSATGSLHLPAFNYQSSDPGIASADRTSWNGGELNIRSQLTEPLILDSANALESHIKVDIDSITLSSKKKKLRLLNSQISCSLYSEQYDCSITGGLKPSKWEQWPIPDLSLTSSVQLTQGTNLQASLTLLAANRRLEWLADINHQLENGQGQAQVRLSPTQLNWKALGLEEMQTLTSVQLLNGTLGGQGWINWDLTSARIEPDLILRGDDISAIYNNEIVAEQWRFLIAVQPLDRLNKPGALDISAHLSGESLNSGINISNLLASSRIRMNESLEDIQISIDEAHASLLGGQIRINNGLYDSTLKSNRIMARIDGIQMSDLARLEPSVELAATGILDGQIPIIIDEHGLSVESGLLKSREPGGRLVYSSDSARALASSDPTAGLAFKALENFQYRILTSEIQYQPSGDAQLKLGFEGKNPDFFDGQSTNLNVKLDYNLLDLMESLRLTNQVIENIEAKYK